MELLSSSILMFSSSLILELPALFGSFKMELLESLFCSCQKLQFAIDCYLVTHPKIKQPCLFAALRLSNMLVTSTKIKGRLSGGSTSSLPKANLSPNGGLQKAQVSTQSREQQASAVLTSGFPQGFHETAFVGKDDMVGEQHCRFLASWFGLGALSTPVARKAWQMAFPNLGSSSVNAVLKKISGIKTYLLRKQRNAKTGERMPPWVKRLLGVLNSHLQKVDPPATEKSKAAMAVSIATAVGDSGTEELSEAQEDAQSLDCISVSSTAPCSQSTQIASLAGEGGLKRPAASSSSVEEKPASNGFKRPASASAGGLKKAIRKAPIAWQQSPSFGFVKFTVATEKSYIVSKQKLDGKPACLVNVQGTGGVDHGQVVGQLMDLVLNEGGLTKAMVVAKKQELLKK